MPVTSTMEPWWAPWKVSRLHWTSLRETGPSLGLHLNRSKSLLVVPSQCDSSNSSLPSDIPVTRGGFCLLGCPIEPTPYCEEVLQDRITGIRKSLAALHDMQDSQLETTLLRSCLALPKFSYILRTTPPSYIEQAARDFDVAVRETLEAIVGIPITEWSWLKASLPSSRGYQPQERFPPCPGSLSGLRLLLPGVGWEDARPSLRLLPPHRVSGRCSLRFRLTARLAGLGGHQCAPAPALPLAGHRRGHTPAPSVICSLHPCPCTGPLFSAASCWRLAEWCAIHCFGAPPPRSGVPLLPAVLAGSATPQHQLLLPRVPQHSGPLWRPPGGVWRQWGQDCSPQRHLRRPVPRCPVCGLGTNERGSQCGTRLPIQASRHTPPHLELWSPRSIGRHRHLPSPAADPARSCLHPWPRPAGRRSA